jgi:putative flavoprotein involved in K+ transport
VNNTKQTQTIVIGGGQAGLAVGYYLAQRGVSFEILDANLQTGDAWRKRWDSLRLFSPARYDGLPGMPFPARGDTFPDKNQVADYLSQYARRFRLPIRHGIEVDRLSREGNRFVMTARGERFEADNVIVAMANYQRPKTPSFAADLDSAVFQLHSNEYKNPSQLRGGPVLVVGVGNSGADIAMDVASSHPTWLAGKEVGHIPWRIDSFSARFLLSRVIRFLGHFVLSVDTPIGRRLRPKMLHSAAPLVRVKPEDLVKARITRVPRVTGAKGGMPLLADGRTLAVSNVIWCTGYHHDFPWIDLPIFDQHGEPLHKSGIVGKLPGMYFLGLHFLHSMSSATLIGISRDAERIANAVAARAPVQLRRAA